MQAKAFLSKMGRGLLAANLAAAVRVLLHGPSTVRHRLNVAYHAIDPFDEAAGPCREGKRRVHIAPDIGLDCVIQKFDAMDLGDAYRFVDGALPWFDLVAILAIARDRMPRAVLEIGTYFGYSTRALALHLPQSTVHTVDLPLSFEHQNDDSPIPKDDFHLIRDRRVGEGFRSDPSIRNIVQHFADTATWDFQAAKDATFFFIDGSHTYEYARNDTEKCLALCKDRRATILWHDYNDGHAGVVRYLSELIEVGFPVKHISYTNLAILDI